MSKMTPSTGDVASLVDFSKIKLGMKSLTDAIFELGDIKKLNPSMANKETVQRAIETGDLPTQRALSNFYYKISGIYQRLCRYLAYLYKYDWVVDTHINQTEGAKEMPKDKVVRQFNQVLSFLDEFGLKKFFGETALQVIRDGSFYGYLMERPDKRIEVQELPVAYCRSRFKCGNLPVVEFNMKYFDDAFRDAEQRIKILKTIRVCFSLQKQRDDAPERLSVHRPSFHSRNRG